MSDVKEGIRKIIEKELTLPNVKVFLFGGRLKEQNPRKDIDIGILGEAQIPVGIFNRIEEGLEELPILQKIDLVDFSTVSEDFKALALQNIEVLYEN